MNIRRGLFRIWVLVSVLWAITIIAFMYSPVSREFARGAEAREWAKAGINLLPVPCSQTRGKLGTDYSARRGNAGPWDNYSNIQPGDFCWYEEPKFRALYPEYKDLNTRDLSEKLYSKAVITLTPQPKPWEELLQAAAIAVLPPLTLFMLGAAILWALAGFRATNTVSK
ncbi:hypothetical protein V5G24_10020 [Xanthobacter sp. VTT E-85241]|uniref:hypothetical protein n=1 Tax=Roseixanthobacter finlandensis TaxID=3119922 RepID=UPI00372CBAEE